jgi:hypothetical protein
MAFFGNVQCRERGRAGVIGLWVVSAPPRIFASTYSASFGIESGSLPRRLNVRLNACSKIWTRTLVQTFDVVKKNREQAGENQPPKGLIFCC